MPRLKELVLQEGESLDLPENADLIAGRFQELVEAKYTRSLSAAESSELDRLEGGLTESDVALYGPILKRLKSRESGNAKRQMHS